MGDLAAYIAAVLAARPKPDRLADRRRRRRARQERGEPRPVTQRPSTRYAIKGEWTAAEVEPYLAPPKSSLDPAGFTAHHIDAEEQ